MVVIRFIQRAVTYLQGNVWYALFMVALALASIVMLGYGFLPAARPEVVSLLERFDIVIAVIFMIDFFAGLFFNVSLTKREYWRQNWLNFIASVPITSEVTQMLRILRIFQAVRVIRAAMELYYAKQRYEQNRELNTKQNGR
jgi:hypothetical protein